MSYNCTRVQGTGTCYGNLNSNGGCDPCDAEVGMMDNHISKTRGVPSQGSTNYGARGQELAFRNASGRIAPNTRSAARYNAGSGNCSGSCGLPPLYLGCATCGPGCNCDCVENKCVSVPRSGKIATKPRKYANASGTPLWFNQTSTTTTEPAVDKYTNIFKEKNYWIGVVVGIAGLMAYQKYVKK